MNAYIAFRNNGLGQLFATRTQRSDAAKQVVGNLRARLIGARGMAPPGAAAAPATAAATAKAQDAPPATQEDEALSRDAFLQLLVMQMRNQDPLSPFDNTQMVAQLAQFSSLEQMHNLNDSFADLSGNFDALTGNVDQLNFISAQALLGRPVQGFNLDGERIEGIVDSVHLDGSIVVLTVDGEHVPMSGVISVGEPLPADPGDTPKDAAP